MSRSGLRITRSLPVLPIASRGAVITRKTTSPTGSVTRKVADDAPCEVDSAGRRTQSRPFNVTADCRPKSYPKRFPFKLDPL